MTQLVAGDIAIVGYDSQDPDSFTFVILRDIDAGTVISFTDNGWLASGGFRSGEGTVTYTAATAVAAGTVITLTGLDLDSAGDQIIAYQGDPTTPTVLYVVDLADGNNTVAGDATNDNTTALPPGFTLNLNAAAIAFDNASYAGPTGGAATELFAAINDPANWISIDTLPAQFTFRPDLDLDRNNSTSLGRDYRAEITSGGPAVRISDTDTDIDDRNDFLLSAAEIDIRGTDPGDLLAINGSLPAGIFATSFDPSSGTLTLFGLASHAAYEAAIQQIEFSTTQPVGTLKTIEVNVFDGQLWSRAADAFIRVSGVAAGTAPPVLDLDANNSNGGGADYTATFTSGGPAIPVADTDVSVTDPDSTTIESATITIGINRQPDDVLSIVGSLPPGISASSYNATTGVLTLTGSATLADYQTALRQVGYSSTDPTPFTADRIIQVTVNDGTSDSNIGTTYMHVAAAPPNVPPVLDLDANNSTTPGANYLTGFTEGGPAVAIADVDVDITDANNTNIVSATITLTNPQAGDVLSVSGLPGSISASAYNPATGILTLTGSASLADYETALQLVQFSNGNINPSTAIRTINVVVNDGASNSNTATSFIQVEVVNNSAPMLDLDPDDSGGSARTTFRSGFTENGAPVPIADVDTSITDLDSTTLVSATITLANPQSGDLLTVSGTLPAGIIASGYDPVSGVLTLTGLATLDEYEAALQQVLFSNNGDDPVTQDRLIEVVVNDGVNDSNVAGAVISVTATNDPPVLGLATSASYQENTPPVALSPLATLADADDIDFDLAVVTIIDGSFVGDGDILSVGGATSGIENGITFNWDASLHALVFIGASSVANYQALLQAVQFQSTSDNPTDFDASPQRTLTWAVSDGASVTTATTTLDIAAVNDPPQETVAATAAYTENGSAVTISPAATASDVDDVNLVSGLVRIVAGGFDGDVLTVNGQQSGTFSGIDFSYDAGLRALVFGHPASVASFQAFMQAVEFNSTSENPTNFGANPTRTLRWGLSDGENYSAAAQLTQIVVNPIDDPAAAQNDAVATTENTAIVAGNVFANNGSGADNDPDSLSFSVTAVSGGTVGAQFALPSGALLTVNADGTFSYDPNHLFDYLPASGSGASNLTVTDTFSYTVTGGDTAIVTVTIGGIDTDDVLRDSASVDNLAGGGGNDVYYVSNTGDVVTEAANSGFDTVAAGVNYTLPASVEVLNMIGSGLIGTGSAGAETFVSSGGPNTLVGLGGDDVYYVNNTGDAVIEAANGGIDTVEASVDYTLPASSNIEGLYMLGSGLTGTGSDGAETLYSSGGPNRLVGLGGNDLYYVNNAADVVVEAANGGIDTVAATVDYTMPDNAEGLYMFGSGLTGTGTGNADSLLSSGGPNTLVGLGGDDIYYISNAADMVIEAANGGFDSVMASVSYILPANVEALYMDGSGLTGIGNSGANTLVNHGTNTLVGGDGDDTFVFFAGSANGATVADFNRDQVDEWDFLVFSGFGTEAQGATLSQIGSTDQWQIHSGLDAHDETITFSNHAALLAGDFAFV